MSDHPAGKRPEPGKAEHGAPSEVNWNSGAGHQPYSNQGDEEMPPAAGGEFAEGDRGELSGRNQEQLDDVKKKP